MPGNAGPHLDLAAWCIAQGLWAEAGHELNEARRLEPRHPKIPLLERRLAIDQRTAAQPAGIPSADAEPDDTQREDESEAAPEVPKAVLDTFTASVQPILQNHCSAAACHGPTAKSSFRLVRQPYGLPNPRTTQQNLRAVLRLVDREHPSQSPLLMTPIQPHGKIKEAVFKARDTAKYRQLVAWVNQVSGGGGGGSSEVAGKTKPDQQPPLLQTAKDAEPPISSQRPPETIKPAGFRTPADGDDRSAPQQSLPQRSRPADSCRGTLSTRRFSTAGTSRGRSSCREPCGNHLRIGVESRCARRAYASTLAVPARRPPLGSYSRTYRPSA